MTQAVLMEATKSVVPGMAAARAEDSTGLRNKAISVGPRLGRP